MNPYPEWDVVRANYTEAAKRAAWSEGAACGVAAERARWEPLVSELAEVVSLYCEDTDPPQIGTWAWGIRNQRAFDALGEARAALSPERTTGEDA